MSTINQKQALIRAMNAKGISTQIADVAANVCVEYVRLIRERLILEDAKNFSVRKAGQIIGLSKSAVDKIRHAKKRKRPELPSIQLKIKFRYFYEPDSLVLRARAKRNR